MERKTRTHQEELKDAAGLRRLAVLVRDSNDAIMVKDFSGNILAWNRGAEKMYGYTEKEALGMNILDLVPEEKREEYRRMLAGLEHGEPIISFETRRLTKDGRVLDAWLIVTPLPDEEGRVRTFSTTERDITERKRKEQELIIANKELAFQSREKEKRADELIIANKELVYQNEEKEKRAAELIIANKELVFQNEEKEKRAAELIIANKELVYQNEEKEKRADELKRSNEELAATVEALRASEALLPAAIDILPVGLWIIDAEGKIVTSSAAAQRIWAGVRYVGIDQLGEYKGWRTDSGKPIEAHEWAGARALEKGETTIEQEVEIECFDGTHKIILDSAVPLRRSDGSIGGAVTINQDITERRRAEEALKESEAKFKRLYDSNIIGVIFWDTAGNISQANSEFLRIVGYTEEDVLSGKARWKDMTPPEYAYLDEKALKEMAETGVSVPFEKEYIRKDGSRVPVIIGAVIFKGQRDVGICFVQDITDRKRAEEALASSEQFLSNVIEQSPVSLWISDSEGTLIKLNQSCRELFGATDEEVVGKYNLLKDNLIEEQGFIPLVENVFEKGDIARFTIDYDLPRVEHVEVKEGTHRILDVVVSPIKDIHGKLTNVLVQHKDITERKRAEEALLESNANIRGLVDATPESLFLIKLDGTVQAANESVAKRLGRTVEELEGHNIWEVLPPEVTRNRKPRIEAIIRSGKPDHFEDDRSGRSILNIVHPVLNEQGQVKRLAILGIDITERKRAEEALRTSEERFRTAAESITDIVYEWDLKEKLDWFGDIDKLMGYPAGKFPRTLDDWAKTVHPEDIEGVWKAVEGQLKGAKPYTLEYRVRKKDGEWRWWSARGTALRNERGEPYKWIGAITDITERRRAEEALHLANAYNRSLIEASLDPLVTIGRDGKIADVNAATEKVTGYSRQDLVGNDFLDYFMEPEKARAGYQRVFKEGYVVDYPLEIRHKDGRITSVLYNASVYRDEKGEVSGIFAAARDITERKRAEESLRKSVADLKRSNEELQQFAYVASHDLQEPLRAVASFTQLLSQRYKGRLDKDADEFIAFAVGGANRMQTLINDLLSYSRLETRGKPPEPTDSHDALGQALANLGTAIRESVALVTNDDLPKVLADESQLVQLFQNLVGNAIKFHGKEPPRVHVSAALQGREWLFSVRDNGIGIAQEYQERIFSIFQRLHSREEYPGTGIGLALCKRIVERHGGTIRVESEPGSGSTFFFTLPKP